MKYKFILFLPGYLKNQITYLFEDLQKETILGNSQKARFFGAQVNPQTRRGGMFKPDRRIYPDLPKSLN